VVATPSSTDGYGLLSIRERLRLVGGQLEIDSSPDRLQRVRQLTYAQAFADEFWRYFIDETRHSFYEPGSKAEAQGLDGEKTVLRAWLMQRN